MRGEFGRGPQIEGDLKIREFLFDKALIARTGNPVSTRHSTGLRRNR